MFVHGFLGHPRDYATMLTHVASHGIGVLAPVGHRRGPTALRGTFTPRDEAARVAPIMDTVGDSAVGGHSRGGQVAWLVAAGTPVEAVVAVDPVDGTRRSGTDPDVTRSPATWTAPTLVIGAAVGGRCAPDGRNHAAFAAAAPAGSRHVLVPMGHADLLDGRMRTIGRWLCPGVRDAAVIPRVVAGLIVAHLLGEAIDDCPVPLAG